jgi:sec-independent protein translocase protein TatA
LLILVVVLLFGTGRISGVMGDFAKGLKAFRKNMADDSDVSMEAEHRVPASTIAPPQVPPAAAAQAVPQPQPTTVNHG